MDIEKYSFELALTATGDRFTPAEEATDWRVKEIKGRGVPGTKYFQDGRVMTAPINATPEELREIVGQPGKYRLDQVDGDGKLIAHAQPAYIVLGQLARTEELHESLSVRDEGATTNDLMRDILRLNAELARQVARPVTTATDALLLDVVRMNTTMANAVIERFSTMMDSGAGVIAAADGAGLPAREPRELASTDDEGPQATNPASPTLPPSTLTIIAPMITEIVNNVVNKLMDKSAPVQSSSATTAGARTVAHPAPGAKSAASPNAATAITSSGATSSPTSSPTPSAQTLPPLDPMVMAKMFVIQSQLTKDEADLAKALATELSPTELRAWAAELTAMPVADAVGKIRAVLGAPAASAASETAAIGFPATVGGAS